MTYSSNLNEKHETAVKISSLRLSLRDAFLFVSSPVSLRSPDEEAAFVAFATSYALRVPINLQDYVDFSNDLPPEKILRREETNHKIVMLYLWLAMRFPHFSEVALAKCLKDECEERINNFLESFSSPSTGSLKKDVKIIDVDGKNDPVATTPSTQSSREDEY